MMMMFLRGVYGVINYPMMLRVMRWFQNGITLDFSCFKSILKVAGGWSGTGGYWLAQVVIWLAQVVIWLAQAVIWLAQAVIWWFFNFSVNPSHLRWDFRLTILLPEENTKWKCQFLDDDPGLVAKEFNLKCKNFIDPDCAKSRQSIKHRSEISANCKLMWMYLTWTGDSSTFWTSKV